MTELFATLSLDGSGLQRHPAVRSQHWQPGYLDQFDGQTLWLDAVQDADRVILVMPRLHNLRKVVRRATFRLDGQPVPARFRTYYRHSYAILPKLGHPRTVSVQIGDWHGETIVQPDQTALFAGRNVLFTLSKNDDPHWIEDWARFHRVHHGANAVLFVDNGSDTPLEAIDEAFARAGLPERKIASTSLRYGPRGKSPYANSENFLQTGVMNACRFRFLKKARAVLGNDVDELILTKGRSVFDEAAQSRMGYVYVPGQWMLPGPVDDPPGHGDHIWRNDPVKPSIGKWCIVPDGPLRRYSWRPHKPDNLFYAGLLTSKDSCLLHCRGVTNGWKRPVFEDQSAQLVEAPEVKAALMTADVVPRSKPE